MTKNKLFIFFYTIFVVILICMIVFLSFNLNNQSKQSKNERTPTNTLQNKETNLKFDTDDANTVIEKRKNIEIVEKKESLITEPSLDKYLVEKLVDGSMVVLVPNDIIPSIDIFKSYIESNPNILIIQPLDNEDRLFIYNPTTKTVTYSSSFLSFVSDFKYNDKLYRINNGYRTLELIDISNSKKIEVNYLGAGLIIAIQKEISSTGIYNVKNSENRNYRFDFKKAIDADGASVLLLDP